MADDDIEVGEDIEVAEITDADGNVVGAVIDDVIVATSADGAIVDELIEVIDADGDVVAVDETGAVVGTVTSCPLGSPYRELGTDAEGEFRALAVAPAARGRGVGTLLVRRCLERAAADGFDQVVISSAEWMTTAHRMYRRLGFTRVPERDWWPRPDVHLLAYVHPLG